MVSRRVLTAIAVLTGAMLAVQVFSAGYGHPLVRLVFDLFVFAASLALFSRIRPAATTRRELGRFALGPVFYFVATLLGSFLAERSALSMLVSGNTGWLLTYHIPVGVALAWSALSVARLGGAWWLKHRRSVIVAVVLTLAISYLDTRSGYVLLVALYVVLFVIPSRFVEEISGKWGWWVLGLVCYTPLAALFFSTNLEVSFGEGAIPATLITIPLEELLKSSLFDTFSTYLALFWLLLPVRLIVALFQGTFGLRVPIWSKLALTYLFSTVIPAILFLALIVVTIYLGIGTMRAREVRNFLYDDLQNLQNALASGRIESYAAQDSVAEAVYMRITPDPAPRRSIQPLPVPPRPATRGGQEFGDELPLATLPQEWLFNSSLDSLASPTVPEEVWIRVASRPSAWALPDTLPLFPGWTDSTTSRHGILPIGNGRSAFAAAVSKRAGSRIVNVALKPLNRRTLERYKEVIGADISVSPYSEFTLEIAKGLRESEGNAIRIKSVGSVDPRWRDAGVVRTFTAEDTSLSLPLHKRSLYHGVCELQSWPSGEEKHEFMSGQVSVRTSLMNLLNSLYTSKGLNKVTLVVIGVLAAMFGLAVLFSTILGFGINRTITSSVAALRSGTEQLRTGDLSVRINVKNRDELGDLAESFNQMTADLRRMLHEVGEKERLEREVQIAREIQLKLLPASIPQPDGLRIEAKSVPALEVGGDYYDVIDLGERGLLLALGDVSGKGVGAAILMSNLQANLHVLSSQNFTLDKVVAELNRQICRNSTSEMFITFFVALIDPSRGSMQYVNAGHDLPALLRDGKTIDLEKGGMLLGVVPDAGYEVGRAKLHPGDLIVTFSDGLTEAMNEAEVEFGRDRLLKCIRHLNGDQWVGVDPVFDVVRDFAGEERTSRDDLTLLVVRMETA